MSCFRTLCLFAASLLLSAASSHAAIWIKGGDCSSLAKSEALGGKYYTSAGVQGDALAILKANGSNTVRLRIWNNSPDGYHNKAKLLTMAKRVKAQGMKLLVDFHYSDTWADPGQQSKPAAWSGYSLSWLNTAVYNFTYDVCKALVDQGTPADYVQIGNETNDGLLWDEGRLSTVSYNFSNMCQILRSGINGAKAASSSTAIVLHIANGGSWDLVMWWFDSVAAQGISWDYTGVSYYPYWHGTLSAFKTTMTNAAARYAKPVLVCETAYPFTLNAKDSTANVIGLSSQLVSGYGASSTGQYNMLKAICDIMNSIPNGRGAGVLWWDATWTAVTGNGWDNTTSGTGNNWENQALFGYDSKALKAQTVFKLY